MQEKIARLEALLFTHGEPMKRLKVEKILEVKREECEALIKALQAEFASEARGLTLLSTPEEIQLVTKPQFGGLLLAFMKEELTEELTPATLEALSLVAYGGPISRARLDFLRGVNSSFTLRTLRLRGLVEKSADPAAPHSTVYDLTADSLRHLGVGRREELPRYAEFHTYIDSAATQGFKENIEV
ncbi:MAG: SMC-Scp complex subunit ScpB [Candidatus Liptonbacteria bacterium]|nr:SMC-Scp complex subunit ScpB [Candidatus Liptonbacteria bacterium]